MENSFQSKGSKNFVLKSDYLNNTNNSKKNSFFYDANMNGLNQKAYLNTQILLQNKKMKMKMKIKIKLRKKPFHNKFLTKKWMISYLIIIFLMR